MYAGPTTPVSGGYGTPAVPVSGGYGGLVPVTWPLQEPVVAQIAEIQVTPSTVRTPTGQFPLRGSSWLVNDQWIASQATPTWAIVLAIVGFFCLTIFSLLFLLAKETRYSGSVQVMVSNGPHQYATRIPVISQAQVYHLNQQVNYVRSLAAA
jgi:hypothetical protein